MTTPDLFTNVHKGLRKALFDTCLALGRAGDEPQRITAARASLKAALRFVGHHGENEDVLLLPLLNDRAPDVVHRMGRAHEMLGELVDRLKAGSDTLSPSELYESFCHFVALYLEHMREEEAELEPLIRAALSLEEQASFGRRSVERTAPDDQRMMLGWMLPAMPRAEVEAFLSRVPPAFAKELEALASSE